MIAILQRITGYWGRGEGGTDCLQNTGSKDISRDRISRAGAEEEGKCRSEAGVKTRPIMHEKSYKLGCFEALLCIISYAPHTQLERWWCNTDIDVSVWYNLQNHIFPIDTHLTLRSRKEGRKKNINGQRFGSTSIRAFEKERKAEGRREKRFGCHFPQMNTSLWPLSRVGVGSPAFPSRVPATHAEWRQNAVLGDKWASHGTPLNGRESRKEGRRVWELS